MSPSLVVGNWKMNGSRSGCVELARGIVDELRKSPTPAEVGIAPPYIALHAVRDIVNGSNVRLGAQNCHWEDSGAYTGEISPPMIKEAGCEFVILGHSERRHLMNETDAEIARKIAAVLKHGLRPIICVGETLQERSDGRTAAVIGRQLESALKAVSEAAIEQIEIAYEPVWAIGTGQNATPEQAGEVHRQIRNSLAAAFGASGKSVRILYGGSVKADNAGALSRTPDVNGFLVGGASLKADTFLPIIRSYTGG